MRDSVASVDAQQVFKSTFIALIKENCPIGADIDRYHSVFGHVLSKVGFSISKGIFILASNLNLNIGKTVGYNNKLLLTNKKGKLTQIKI